ncbi:flagellar assembly protein FliW [Sporomusa acidovorans]|uniref:Flagellar assembly factor FliW n=1 Tax=Sporomusa acidovorans (strain ATCC 49682 / DSM 3132 / Mol) TaxID=1123286 RepID=A0ABZ3J848_SPOA4|nr:flagellar assembly protein FliW [Sporomusa acidovorans]OZC19413.1 flagellar assembly factor FliW [Sporomusa acidovorans DSM 3132]SDD77252.1 flagellar assembly factor FliW [Sporomusa acidovorans]
MLIHTTRFGDIEVSEDMLLQFPHGLPGFPDEREFACLPVEENNPFAFLQSVNEPNLTFTLVDPFAFFQDYEFSLDDQVAKEIGLTATNLPRIYNIVSVPANPEEMTANLLAPLIINTESRKAIQMILEKTAYTTRHRLFPNGFDKQPGKGGK